MADEGGMQSTHVAKEEDFDAVNSKSIVLKVVQVVISIFAVGLIVDPFDSFHQIFNHPPKPKLDDIAVIYVTIAGFIMINAILILGHLLGDRMPKRTSVLFSATGAIMHIVAGSVIIHNWRKLHGNYAYIYNSNTYPSKQYQDMLIAGAFFTFVDALVFAVDVFFTIKYF
ncbi:uncharacterized protein LOC100679946 [Nasonia vitripennis]|uniref:MARVEL domain-containing protein n=2 Tax=Pteromalinae TaxID=272242 RepID=A0A7M7QJ25_NASVI|nr:uncharacterized protein LOC100679946 [Nasonia vitripennis]XP_032457084.1 uncharacterized protein LOC100679946 [Nasonia vitripennis]XP_032457085.1 uncharacterized protein LOC100679946 [Nasonia vitripennis]XP_032457086.1 uncharacterized protein LOC100679946 [Nasonia vitripennis]XP_032457087.1 uncharacterized protein LOC100679946 [Nasonia vitripennis]OXU25702.1 hypothetical protein TSAR_014131 [Trichomalopsis sarcophagae]